MRVLHLEDDEDISHLIKMKMEQYCVCEFIQFSKISDAINHLKQDNLINIIIFDFHLSDGNADRFYHFVRERDSTLPFILLTGSIQEDNIFVKEFLESKRCSFLVDKISYRDQLESSIQMALSVSRATLSENKLNCFMPITASTINRIDGIPFDLYIKISDEKYVKIQNEKDWQNSIELTSKYIEKGVLEFYVRGDNYLQFLDYSLDYFIDAQFDRTIKSAPTHKLEHQNIFEITRKRLSEMGFSDNLILATENLVTRTLTIIKDDEEIFTLLNNSFGLDDYLYSHAMFISYITSVIINHLEWGNEELKRKEILAAFFHDIKIDSELAFKLDVLSGSGVQPSEQELLMYERHPYEAVTLLQKCSAIPQDVVTIISQHHEKDDGSGFPKGLHATAIHPLSLIFIFAHEFSNYCHLNGFNKKIRELFLKEFLSKPSDLSYKMKSVFEKALAI